VYISGPKGQRRGGSRVTTEMLVLRQATNLQVHQETFGKSGCRRIVPGEYLAVDPKGRACMIGAVEKQKLVRNLICVISRC
jgi:Mono-functional DNA-alkylating methyl methanesulfonate N-term